MDGALRYDELKFQSKAGGFIGYSVIALSFIFIAQDNTLLQNLQIPSFYTDVLFAFASTFLTALYLRKLNQHINNTYPMDAGLRKRISKQIIMGVLLPTTALMLLETAYLYAIGISFSNSSILNLELPLTIIFLIIVNLLYFVANLTRLIPISQLPVNPHCEETEENVIEFIIVQSGAREDRIELDNCAYLYSSSKVVWLQTFSGQQYRVKGTLEQWEEKLSKVNFFRINRQYLSVPNAISSVEQTETRKLKVNFAVQPQSDVFISKPNIVRFRQWWNNSSPN